MNRNVFITCAVTGASDAASKSPHLPITPEQIARSALDAHAAGAAIVHLHVRDPKTGAASRSPELFREVVDRIRSVNREVIINLTGGMGGEILFGPIENPLSFHPSTDFVGPNERMHHIIELSADIGSLDAGSVNFDDALYATTPTFLRRMCEAYKAAGVRPEIEVFELGHIELAKQLIKEGLIESPPLFQLCLGIKYAAPSNTEAMKAMRDALPQGSIWAAFGIGTLQMPMVAQAVLLGGNVRVGLEDNLYLERGVLATNAQLVERAKTIVELLGSHVMTAGETRAKLGLRPTSF